MSTKLSTSLETGTNKLTSLVEDLNSSLGHFTKMLIPQLNKNVLELASSFDTQFKALPSPSNLAALEDGHPAPDRVDNVDGSSRVTMLTVSAAQPPLECRYNLLQWLLPSLMFWATTTAM